MARQRLDHVLVARGLVESRTQAGEAIEAGRVLVGGAVADKASRQVAPSDPIEILGSGPRFVSRGGHKLQAALDQFDIDVSERTAVDAGSATGGFTDCLLQAGAHRVLAVDVGYGQIHERLLHDPRVVSLERTNIRSLDRLQAASLLAPNPAPTIVSADLSFTSLEPLLATLLEISGPSGDVLALCKPQFEVGREVAARGKGVIRERSDRRRALDGLVGAADALGAAIMGVVSSPILGPAGNAEFVLHIQCNRAMDSATVATKLESALDVAETLS